MQDRWDDAEISEKSDDDSTSSSSFEEEPCIGRCECFGRISMMLLLSIEYFDDEEGKDDDKFCGDDGEEDESDEDKDWNEGSGASMVRVVSLCKKVFPTERILCLLLQMMVCCFGDENSCASIFQTKNRSRGKRQTDCLEFFGNQNPKQS